MYIADLHIHSRYSRATSRDLTPEQLELWARRKGIRILGTGDFTHPAWRRELKEKLIGSGNGLYRLKEEFRIRDNIAQHSPQPEFVITGEISSIYKADGRVRKVHSLILLPGLDEAERLALRLEEAGNLHSDGRPILGLSCHDLLEITLTVCPDAVFVPAHIWTPHFSLFGAFSGFDTVQECFGDLTPYIHAMETGLSSDPPMNWRLSMLDSYQLISNSDAHSASKLGREATLFDIPMSYQGLKEAIETGRGLEGTIEFFPEEGKYHYDGHRKCSLCLSPDQTLQYSGICPVCGKRLTIGVAHRAQQLSDRPEGYVRPGAKHFESLVPLTEVIASCMGCSASGVRVVRKYEELLGKLGNEFSVLREIPEEEIERAAGEMIAEGIRRLRRGKVRRQPGYDGEYGSIGLFEAAELERLSGQLSFFSDIKAKETGGRKAARANRETGAEKAGIRTGRETGTKKDKEPREKIEPKEGLNQEQLEAVTSSARAVAVEAGPGTGKTRTLTARIEYLIWERNVLPSQITAVTFTNRAAGEMRTRLSRTRERKRAVQELQIGTFHSICLHFLQKHGDTCRLADEAIMLELAENTVKELGLSISPSRLISLISLKKSGKPGAAGEIWEEAFRHYQRQLDEIGAMDYDDLLLRTLQLVKKGGNPGEAFTYLLADEFQDCSPAQYELLRAWNKTGVQLFVIGDPDQAIYGFRGSDAGCFERFAADYPDCARIRLTRQYRSCPEIVDAACAVISHNPGGKRPLTAVRSAGMPVRVYQAESETEQAMYTAREIGRLVGGIDMLDAGEIKSDSASCLSGFSDIAVLYRTHRQAELLETCLKKEGIPYVTAGREDYLKEKTVRGTVCFFRSIQEEGAGYAGRLAGRILWGLEENTKDGLLYKKKQDAYRQDYLCVKPYKLLERFIKEEGLVRNESMQKLSSASRFYASMPQFLADLALGREADLRRCGGKRYVADAVTLSTLHGAKGLEYPVVILYGVRDGILPAEYHVKESGSDSKLIKETLEEERRLFYVGMTRAKEELLILAPKEHPSRFLSELPEKGVVWEKAKEKECGIQGRQMSLFDFVPEKE